MTECYVRHPKNAAGSAIGLLVLVLFTACCSGFHLSHNCKPRHLGQAERLLPQYQHDTFEYSGFQHEVYWRDPNGIDHPPAVLILHELPGLTHECLALANEFVRHGFAVYLPLFFGSAEPEFAGNWTNFQNTVFVTFSSEWKPNRTSVSQPVSRWLRGLIEQKIVVEYPKRKIGVVGMCLTGALPVALLSEHSVGAALFAIQVDPVFIAVRAARLAICAIFHFQNGMYLPVVLSR